MSGNFTEPNGQTMTVKVDSTLKEEKALQAQIEAERQLAVMKEKDFQRRKNALPTKYQESATEQSIDALEQLAERENEQKEEQKRDSASGVVEISATEGGKPLVEHKGQGFDSYTSMVKTLYADEKAGSEEAHAVLNKLTSKVINSMNEKTTCYSLDSSLSDFLAGKGRFKVKQPSDSVQEDMELAN